MTDYIDREAAIAWFMPYVHAGESIEADVVISDLKGMKAADVEPVQEWISVNDRLPDDEQEVLVIAHGWDGRLVYVGSHKRVEAQKSWLTGITNKSSEWSLWGWSYLKEPMVTHWMPLPSTEGLK